MSKNCINKPSIFMKGMTLTMGLGLTSANEPVWSQHRKILNKSFSPNNLKSFVPIFNKEVNLIIKSLDGIIEKGKDIELLEFFEKLTLKISAATILKRDLDPKKFDLEEIAIYFIRIGEYVAEACMKFYYKIHFILKLSEITKFKEGVKGITFCRELIKESLRNLQNNNSDYQEIKSTLDYAFNGARENGLKEEDIYGSLLQIYFGAVDATSSALYYIVLMLALHPEYQERLYEEILSVIPDKNDNHLSLDQMNKCTYLDMVVNESLRIAPVVPTVTRQVCNESFTLENGIKLPKKQHLVIDIFSLHRSKEIWGPDANSFNPDNFLPSNVESRHPFAYIPFTKGLRFCLGWKYGLWTVKISLIKILMRYKFSTDFKYEDLQFQNHIILKLAEKPKIHVQRREDFKSVKLAYKIPSNKWNTILGFGKIAGANSMTLTMGLGLTSANEPVWSQHRKILNKSFSPNNLKSFVPLFNKEVNLIIQNLDGIIEKGKDIELLEFFEQLTLKISAATILKRDLDPKKFDLEEIAIYFIRIGEYVAEACMKFYYKIHFILKLSEITKFKEGVKGITFCRELIKESSQNLQNNNSDYPEIKSTLDYALNGVQKNGLKEEEIYGSLMHIFFGAVDATSSALYYIMLMLAMHPKYQDRLFEELMSVIPDKNDNDLTWEQLNKCSYLDMFVNETLRIAPVVPTVTRQVCNESFTLDNGITLPQNQYMVIDIFGLHRSKEIWGPNANNFNPDNFLPSNIESRHPFAYIPFTKGLRFCIGWKYGLLTVKISLIKILMRYKFSTDFKYEDLKFQNHIILKLAEKPKIHMQRRGNL
ncbi:uncharacterized protein ACRADG_011160 [Cochliomyia hominivorax]